MSDRLRPEGMNAVLISAFALGAVLLVAMGLFAVISDRSYGGVTSWR